MLALSKLTISAIRQVSRCSVKRVSLLRPSMVLRQYSSDITPSTASCSKEVARVLDSEINYEKEANIRDVIPQSVSEFLKSNNWTLKETDGEAVVSLQGNKDGAKLTILFDVRQLYSDESRFEEEVDEDAVGEDFENDKDNEKADPEEEAEEGADADDIPVSLKVEAVKANSKLTFDVLLNPEYVNVNNVHISAVNVDPECDMSMALSASRKNAAFTGPNFMDLSEDLQEAMNDYVTSLGLDTRMYDALREYMDHKERHEYINWLKNVRTFF